MTSLPLLSGDCGFLIPRMRNRNDNKRKTVNNECQNDENL